MRFLCLGTETVRSRRMMTEPEQKGGGMDEEGEENEGREEEKASC